MSTASSSEKPVWATGSEQVEVEVVITGENYNVDLDIAKRMKLVQEGIQHETPILLTGCSARDFERALTFCANDREEKEAPSPELVQIIKEMGPPDEATSRITRGLANLIVDDNDVDDDDEEEDETYEPSSDSEASDSGEEYSDTDLADAGTEAIRAERAEFREKEKEKEKQESGAE